MFLLYFFCRLSREGNFGFHRTLFNLSLHNNTRYCEYCIVCYVIFPAEHQPGSDHPSLVHCFYPHDFTRAWLEHHDSQTHYMVQTGALISMRGVIITIELTRAEIGINSALQKEGEGLTPLGICWKLQSWSSLFSFLLSLIISLLFYKQYELLGRLATVLLLVTPDTTQQE